MGFAEQILAARPESQEEYYLRLARGLVDASIHVNKARTELRRACSRLAGCSLDPAHWSIHDCMRYVDLALQQDIN